MPPILVISLILLIPQAPQGRQCFFEISSMPHGHRVGTNKNSNGSTNCFDTLELDVVIFLFATPLLKLIFRVVLFATRCFPVPVTVWPALPDVEVRDREEIENGLDVLLVFCCIISQEVTARAVDDADVPVRQTYFALCFGFHIE